MSVGNHDILSTKEKFDVWDFIGLVEFTPHLKCEALIDVLAEEKLIVA